MDNGRIRIDDPYLMEGLFMKAYLSSANVCRERSAVIDDKQNHSPSMHALFEDQTLVRSSGPYYMDHISHS